MKRIIASMALVAVTASLIFGCQAQNKGPKNGTRNGTKNEVQADEQMSGDLENFYNSLGSTAKKQFDQLDDDHKAMAMEAADAGKKADDAVLEQYKDQFAGKKNGNGNGKNSY